MPGTILYPARDEKILHATHLFQDIRIQVAKQTHDEHRYRITVSMLSFFQTGPL